MKMIYTALINIYSKIKSYFNINKHYQFRIIEEIQSAENSETIFLIQFVAKNVFPKFTASELARTDEILEKFCLSDIKRILHASYNNNSLDINNRIEFKIIAKNLLGNKLYTLASNVDPKFVIKLTPHEIFTNKNLLLSLSKDDISAVCYEAGIDSVFAELTQVRNQQNTNVFAFKNYQKKSC